MVVQYVPDTVLSTRDAGITNLYFLIDTSKFCHKIITGKIEKYSTSKIMDAVFL